MLIALVAAAAVGSASGPLPAFDPKASVPLAPTAADHAPGRCHVRIAADGYQLPDPLCTPGSMNRRSRLPSCSTPHSAPAWSATR